MAALSHAWTSSLVSKIFLLLFLVFSIELHTNQRKNHCAHLKQLHQKKPSYQPTPRNLSKRICEHKKKKFYVVDLLTLWHRCCFNLSMLKRCGDVESNPGLIKRLSA